MNTKITALKKKIGLKEKQLEKKENLAARSKEAEKDLKRELELLTSLLSSCSHTLRARKENKK